MSHTECAGWDLHGIDEAPPLSPTTAGRITWGLADRPSPRTRPARVPLEDVFMKRFQSISYCTSVFGTDMSVGRQDCPPAMLCLPLTVSRIDLASPEQKCRRRRIPLDYLLSLLDFPHKE